MIEIKCDTNEEKEFLEILLYDYNENDNCIFQGEDCYKNSEGIISCKECIKNKLKIYSTER